MIFEWNINSNIFIRCLKGIYGELCDISLINICYDLRFCLNLVICMVGVNVLFNCICFNNGENFLFLL